MLYAVWMVCCIRDFQFMLVEVGCYGRVCIVLSYIVIRIRIRIRRGRYRIADSRYCLHRNQAVAEEEEMEPRSPGVEEQRSPGVDGVLGTLGLVWVRWVCWVCMELVVFA